SPEQLRGDDVDDRGDVWSLSVMLYEAMTGCRPFLGANARAVIAAIQDEDPIPITRYGAGDAALWEILRRGLEKDPAARWPSMRSFGEALGKWGVANDLETDSTGASLAIHWLGAQPAAFDLMPGERARSGRDAGPTALVPAAASFDICPSTPNPVI